MDITVTEIMELADMHAYSKITDGTPAELLPRNLLERKIQQIVSRIAELEVQVWQCGAGAGCCAQAARIEELEAQLEAVGADPDDEAVPANAAESYTQRVIEALYENGDPVSADAAEELQRLAAQLEAVGAVPDGMTHREFGQFLSDVLTAAGLVSHRGQSKGLGQRLADAVMRLRAAPQPAAQALDSVRVFWQQHTPADALSMTMAELHDDVELVIRAARGSAQAAPAGVVEDAARWHWMAEYLVGTRTDLDDELIASATVGELSKLVDADLAARKQGGQHAE